MKLVLWGNGQSRAFGVHWALHELGVSYEKRLIGPRTGETQTDEFLGLNPAGKIPVLQDGALVLTESAAIITYLGETYGRGTGLVPSAASKLRAKYDQWCFFAMTELDAQSLYIVRKHIALSYLYGEAPAAVSVAKQTFSRQAGVLEHALADHREWILGSTFTGADILLAGCLSWGASYELALSGSLSDYLSRATNRDAYRDAIVASGLSADPPGA